MKSITIGIDGIGPVFFERSMKAKRINIYVRPFKGVRVAVPRQVSFRKAEKIVYLKADWIQKCLAKIKKMEQEHEAVSENLTDIDRTEVKEKIVGRLNELAGRNGFAYNRVFIKNQKTRWGSCSARNNINLNMKLIGLPDHLIEYVILHELVHTRVKNHSTEFWSELNRFVGDAKKLNSQLREYKVELL